ncbi:hypothetical protein VNI00_012625 [Paramarasmius palmivorus]|uniref:HAT C-terminal dimerisation domain-containing protein n=1 Tax=Paramarasmius palmivorus TaxID=297713 RepID=A0AAW0C673_9AGAR
MPSTSHTPSSTEPPNKPESTRRTPDSAVERQFSRARHNITWERNRLSAQSIRAIMCVGNWSLLGLVHDDIFEKITSDGAVAPLPGEKDLVDVILPDDFDVIEFSDDEDDSS